MLIIQILIIYQGGVKTFLNIIKPKYKRGNFSVQSYKWDGGKYVRQTSERNDKK